MSSELHVEVAQIDKIEKHPNADMLDLAVIKGWQVVVQKGQHVAGEKVVFVPPDSVLPQVLSDEMNITQYLSNGRLRCIKLRGEPSFGLVMTPKDMTWELGQDVASEYNISKYSPPSRSWLHSRTVGSAGLQHPDSIEEHALFWRYTNIDNLRHFPNALEDAEEVVISEKLHGTNSRVAVIQGEWMAGSHKVRRKPPEDYDILTPQNIQLGNSRHVYWYPTVIPQVKQMLTELSEKHQQVILFGEIFGDSIQSLHYGYKQQLGYRAFDLMLDGRYLNFDEFRTTCQEYGVLTVPILAQVPYSLEIVKALSEGKTTMINQGKVHIREGVVIKPVVERQHPKLGRLILKYVSDSYLVGKESDFTDE